MGYTHACHGGIATLEDMDVMDIITKIMKHLTPDRFFGYLWIFSWIMAVWFFHVQFFVMGLFSLFLSLIIFERRSKHEVHPTTASLSMDKARKALVVQKLYRPDLKWDDYEVCSGMARLPSGEISEGDMILECDGNVALRHVPTNSLVGAFDFSSALDKSDSSDSSEK